MLYLNRLQPDLNLMLYALVVSSKQSIKAISKIPMFMITFVHCVEP